MSYCIHWHIAFLVKELSRSFIRAFLSFHSNSYGMSVSAYKIQYEMVLYTTIE